jgi:O-antigen/teichoic acid export membrane protein
MSYDLSNLPTNELIAPLNRVIFPGYARMAGDRDRLRRGFVKTISIIALVALPAAVGIAAIAELLVPVLLGRQWSDAIPVVQVLALYGAVTALETNTYYVHLALGNIRPFTVLISLSAILLVALVAILTHVAGAVGAAWAYLIVSILFFPLFYRVAMRVLNLDAHTLLQAFTRSVVASAVMYAVVYQVVNGTEPATQLAEVVLLLAAVSTGAVVYTAVTLALWQAAGRPEGAEEFVLSTLRELIWSRRKLTIERPVSEVSDDIALNSKV